MNTNNDDPAAILAAAAGNDPARALFNLQLGTVHLAGAVFGVLIAFARALKRNDAQAAGLQGELKLLAENGVDYGDVGRAIIAGLIAGLADDDDPKWMN